jgi:6 kDa early secretory antigenic target
MGYSLKVDTDDVASKASLVRSQASDLETQLASLTSTMQSLAETWTGTASAAFQSLYQTWKGQATQIQTQLEAISASLNSAGTNYASAEQQNTSALRR